MKLPDENQGHSPPVPAGNTAEWQDLAQQLAHEIKNILTPVRLSAERLLRCYQNDPERLREIFETSVNAIIAGTDNLAALLDDFKTLSWPVETSNTDAALSAVLDECVSIFGAAYPDIHFRTDAADRTLTIAIDPRHLRQILHNLLLNAIDAMNAKGTIEINAQPVAPDGTLLAKISVTDSGGGIGDEAKDKIFAPHWTNKPAGTGLGLPIVKHIAHSYGGSVSFTSAKNAGTTFAVELPRKEQPQIPMNNE
ncbi:MAG: GHKL domain-containing protein [Spirochaetaceae bacterium]|jgi:nitrogen fixation/metabolism regulation signal transduction histidine kinase|nr:GHKL domain-containing protein [Spirochaetaceae bacterium]